MGNPFSSPREINIAVLGLDGAGTTSLCNRLIHNEFSATTPTIGFNIDSYVSDNHRGVQFNLWTVVSNTVMRRLWGHYLIAKQGILFVIDGADCRGARFDEALGVLDRVLRDAALVATAPVVVLVSKQDLENSMKVAEIAMRVSDVFAAVQRDEGRVFLWSIMGCSSQTGEGVREGFERLAAAVVAQHPE